MKKFLVVIATSLGLISLAGCGTQANHQKTIRIGILQIVQHGSLDAARQGFQTELTHQIKQVHPTLQVQYDYQNAQGDQANLNTMAQQLTLQNSQLLLAIGTPAAQTLARKTNRLPILTTAVTDLKAAGLVHSVQKPETNVSGTSDKAPVTKQLQLLTSLTKSKKPLGVIYNSSEENSLAQVATAKQYAKTHHLKLKTISVTTTNDIQSALANFTSQISGLYVPTDNLMASAMSIIGKNSQRAQIPVVTGSIEMAQAGGTATYGLNYRDLGKQTAQMAARVILKQQSPSTTPVETANHLQLYVNSTNSKLIGINPKTIKQP